MKQFIGLIYPIRTKEKFLSMYTDATIGHDEGSLIDLRDKIDNILYYKGGLVDVLAMLDSFKNGVKTLKTGQSDHDSQYEYRTDDYLKYSHEKNLPRAHFKWNHGTRYTLTSNELKVIATFIKPFLDLK